MAKVSPHLVLNYPLFSGSEQEGPYKGAKTLFVAGDKLEYGDIRLYFAGHSQVYLGAGMLSDFSAVLLSDLLDFTDLRVCVEVGKKKDAETLLSMYRDVSPKRLYLVLTMLMMRPNKSIHHINKSMLDVFVRARRMNFNVGLKIDTGTSVTVLHGSSSYTNAIDVSYADDVKLPLPERLQA